MLIYNMRTNGHVLNMFFSTSDRKQVVKSFNSKDLKNNNDTKIALTPFRVANNAGDLLMRQNYSCGGSNQLSNSRRRQSNGMFRGGRNDQCDTSNVEAASCNPKYVYDSSDYSRFKKLSATQKSFSDTSFGGSNRGSQSAMRRVR